jgi:HD-GYP domain-containing protein (c-di-GMP phosphodiesterase class II)
MVRPSRNGAAPWRPSCESRVQLLAALADPTAAEDHAFVKLLVVADVDDFRTFNARHGYEAGDGVLELLERRLVEVGSAFHLWADTFAVLLTGTPIELARTLACVLARLSLEDPEPLQCSLGAVLVPGEASGSHALALAEERLEDQKRRGLFLADRVGEILLLLMGAHDEGLQLHASDGARLSESVAGRLGLGVAERTLVRRTAELHDVGKLAVDRSVLDKSEPLDEAEWEQIRRHTLVGDELLQLFPSLATVASLVRATHERPDGAGYPDGTGADAIPLGARIVSACDAYHAMVSNRPYATARSGDDACAELEAYAGSQFDRSVVSALVAELSDRRPVAEESAATPSEDSSLRRLARLHALLESASVVEDPDHLPDALDAVAQVVGESLGYGGVVINLYRHEWDDFVVSTAYGDDPAIRQLLGSTYEWEIWERLLDPRFHQAARTRFTPASTTGRSRRDIASFRRSETTAIPTPGRARTRSSFPSTIPTATSSASSTSRARARAAARPRRSCICSPSSSGTRPGPYSVRRRWPRRPPIAAHSSSCCGCRRT